jgi:hypothetical protein
MPMRTTSTLRIETRPYAYGQPAPTDLEIDFSYGVDLVWLAILQEVSIQMSLPLIRRDTLSSEGLNIVLRIRKESVQTAYCTF